ncbi:hypothetical protein ACMFMG_001023 [Clarireedia jacksonii]
MIWIRAIVQTRSPFRHQRTRAVSSRTLQGLLLLPPKSPYRTISCSCPSTTTTTTTTTTTRCLSTMRTRAFHAMPRNGNAINFNHNTEAMHIHHPSAVRTTSTNEKQYTWIHLCLRNPNAVVLHPAKYCMLSISVTNITCGRRNRLHTPTTLSITLLAGTSPLVKIHPDIHSCFRPLNKGLSRYFRIAES